MKSGIHFGGSLKKRDTQEEINHEVGPPDLTPFCLLARDVGNRFRGFGTNRTGIP